MSTPNQLSDTPRTDAAWAKTFQDDEDQCRAGNAATDMRDECATLERELAALAAERDQLRAQLHALNLVCGTTDADKCQTWVDRANARAERAEAEVGRLRAGIAECLHTNGHLADGEDCTLIGLKRCLRDPAAARESKGGAA